MEKQETYNYARIEEAIHFLRNNFRKQPSLEEIAEQVHLSPFHFQRLFAEWAGTTPKKFLQYTSVEYAKKLLRENRATLFDTAFETGLSGTGRLHDLFVSIEGMTPAEYKNGGEKLHINYSFAESPFGNILVASTPKGICHLSFYEKQTGAFAILQNQFPNALFRQNTDLIQENALNIFTRDWSKLNEVKLHLKGTKFQLKVWESLLKIPLGRLSTYGNIAREIEQPTASRGVGSAIGKNPVAYLIPCHRVIQSTGMLSGYRWGTARKSAIIGWEAAKLND
ncbi:methylated-DNA--[protein]-cysteine S-methyltransferase [Prolixibacter sp. NT017]|uniref:methylated-DNA--[protein]-cysteine S-methyltransferase n=1 Tax=Prolixibacter sp. NT017 TaxID=2652390 RepID=UPI001278C50F|nr:methylated-DNA--[protein]-cysteine S-methyltransferase [Prolixibacter sp. NT017]GET23933.1 methylated-DNA--protein-cysteine methyltransferase [Prolixibacter sp. NT017]